MPPRRLEFGPAVLRDPGLALRAFVETAPGIEYLANHRLRRHIETAPEAVTGTTPQPIKDSTLLIRISLLPDLGFTHGDVQVLAWSFSLASRCSLGAAAILSCVLASMNQRATIWLTHLHVESASSVALDLHEFVLVLGLMLADELPAYSSISSRRVRQTGHCQARSRSCLRQQSPSGRWHRVQGVWINGKLQ